MLINPAQLSRSIIDPRPCQLSHHLPLLPSPHNSSQKSSEMRRRDSYPACSSRIRSWARRPDAGGGCKNVSIRARWSSFGGFSFYVSLFPGRCWDAHVISLCRLGNNEERLRVSFRDVPHFHSLLQEKVSKTFQKQFNLCIHFYFQYRVC